MTKKYLCPNATGPLPGRRKDNSQVLCCVIWLVGAEEHYSRAAPVQATLNSLAGEPKSR